MWRVSHTFFWCFLIGLALIIVSGRISLPHWGMTFFNSELRRGPGFKSVCNFELDQIFSFPAWWRQWRFVHLAWYLVQLRLESQLKTVYRLDDVAVAVAFAVFRIAQHLGSVARGQPMLPDNHGDVSCLIWLTVQASQAESSTMFHSKDEDGLKSTGSS